MRGTTWAVLKSVVPASPQPTRDAAVKRGRLIAVLLLTLRARISGHHGEGHQDSRSDEGNETSVEKHASVPIPRFGSLSVLRDGIQAPTCPS